MAKLASAMPTRTLAALLVGCLLVMLAVVSCGDDDDNGLTRAGVDDPTPAGPSPTVGLPSRPAPFDIANLDLPGDVSEVVAVMSQLPESIDGLDQADPIHGDGDVQIHYRNPDKPASAPPAISIRAINIESSEGTYPPDWTAAQVVDRAALPGDDILDAGVDGDTAWARRSITVSGGSSSDGSVEQEFLFGEATGHWVYSIRARDEELLEVAISTLIEAMSSAR